MNWRNYTVWEDFRSGGGGMMVECNRCHARSDVFGNGDSLYTLIDWALNHDETCPKVAA